MVKTMARKLGDNRACSRILPGLPTHLVRELNVGTVVNKVWQSGLQSCIMYSLPTHLVHGIKCRHCS